MQEDANIKRHSRAGDAAQLAECLFSMHKALVMIPSTA